MKENLNEGKDYKEKISEENSFEDFEKRAFEKMEKLFEEWDGEEALPCETKEILEQNISPTDYTTKSFVNE